MSQEEIISKVKQAIETDPDKDYIQSVSLFGSFLHGNTKSDSDVDLFFEQRKAMGYFKLFDIQQRLKEKLGCEVDLVPKDSLDKYIRDEIIAEGKKIYEHE
ncbi:MAG: nucleotidyltransferase domain-containing protein [Patescibacteria group bacterium]